MSRWLDIPILYGSARPEPGGPVVRLGGREPLRLSHGPYPFAEPPDLIGNASINARLSLLREHLATLCGPWDRPARTFLDAYFAYIAAAIAGHADEVAALAARAGGIFVPADWSFSALRPLPQAHLGPVRVDFAFWTGARIVAVELLGSASPRRQRKDELARLESEGVVLVPMPAADLSREGDRLLARLMPPEFQRFWDGVVFPASPFGAEALNEIVGA